VAEMALAGRAWRNQSLLKASYTLGDLEKGDRGEF